MKYITLILVACVVIFFSFKKEKTPEAPVFGDHRFSRAPRKYEYFYLNATHALVVFDGKLNTLARARYTGYREMGYDTGDWIDEIHIYNISKIQMYSDSVFGCVGESNEEPYCFIFNLLTSEISRFKNENEMIAAMRIVAKDEKLVYEPMEVRRFIDRIEEQGGNR